MRFVFRESCCAVQPGVRTHPPNHHSILPFPTNPRWLELRWFLRSLATPGAPAICQALSSPSLPPRFPRHLTQTGLHLVPRSPTPGQGQCSVHISQWIKKKSWLLESRVNQTESLPLGSSECWKTVNLIMTRGWWRDGQWTSPPGATMTKSVSWCPGAAMRKTTNWVAWQQKFMVSQFSRLEVRDGAVGSVGSFWGREENLLQASLPALVFGSPFVSRWHSVSSPLLPSMCVPSNVPLFKRTIILD